MIRLQRDGWSFEVRGAPAGGAEAMVERFGAGGLAAIADTSGPWSLVARRGERVLVATDPFAGEPLFLRGDEVVEPAEVGGEVEPRMVGQHLDARLDDPTVTWFRGVRRVPGGWGGPPGALHRIWNPAPVDVPDPVAAIRAAVQRLELPQGSLALSGGLDSSVLATLPGPVDAVRNAFEGWACDEARYAEAVADRVGLDLRPIDSRGLGPELLEAVFEPPVFPPVLVNHYLNLALLENARGPLITGFGGDEVFGHGLGALSEWGRAGQVGRVWREAAWLVLRERIAGASWSQRLGSYGRKAVASSLPRAERGPTRRERHWRTITHPFVQRSREEQAQLARWVGRPLVQPLLDPTLAAVSLSIPDTARIARGRTRSMVREAFADVLPDLVRQRTDKADLSRSFDEAFDRFLPHAWSVIRSGVLGPWRTPRELARLRTAFEGGDHLAGAALWRAYGAARWLTWHAGRRRRG